MTNKQAESLASYINGLLQEQGYPITFSGRPGGRGAALWYIREMLSRVWSDYSDEDGKPVYVSLRRALAYISPSCTGSVQDCIKDIRLVILARFSFRLCFRGMSIILRPWLYWSGG
jgi:hypothetical protein